jgi:anti-sigma factor RsiW
MVDGAATERERAVVDAHTAACVRCRQFLAEARRLRILLADSPARATSDEFEQRLSQALSARIPARNAAWNGIWQRLRLRYEWRLRMPAFCAAGSVMAGLLAVAVVPRLPVQGTSSPGTVQVVKHWTPRPETEAAVVDWDSVQASVDLSTGSVLDQ